MLFGDVKYSNHQTNNSLEDLNTVSNESMKSFMERRTINVMESQADNEAKIQTIQTLKCTLVNVSASELATILKYRLTYNCILS
jgi:hypothetical protein